MRLESRSHLKLPFQQGMSSAPCSVEFQTPYEALAAHHEKCGTAYNVDTLVEANVPVSYILKGRSVDQGCGRDYYDCPSRPDTLHIVQTCTQTYADSDGNSGPCLDMEGNSVAVVGLRYC